MLHTKISVPVYFTSRCVAIRDYIAKKEEKCEENLAPWHKEIFSEIIERLLLY